MDKPKGGDGRIDLAELKKLDDKLGGVKPDKKALKKLLESSPKPDPRPKP